MRAGDGCDPEGVGLEVEAKVDLGIDVRYALHLGGDERNGHCLAEQRDGKATQRRPMPVPSARLLRS